MADGDTDTLEPKADTIEPPKSVTAPPRLLTPERVRQFGAAADEALKTAGEPQKQIAESAAREAEILRHRTEMQRQPRQDVVSAIDEELRVRQANPPQPPAQLPERPKLRYSLHEIMGPPGSDKPVNRFMDQIGVLAAISGRTPQERMLLAVTAFNGMIEGWAKGKQEDFQQRYNEWKDEVSNIRDTETRRRQYIQDVLNDAKASTELKSLKLQVLGQEDGDRLLVEAAIQKQWGAIDKGTEEKFKLVDGVIKTAESIDKTLQKQSDDHEAMDFDAKQYILTGNPIFASYLRSKETRQQFMQALRHYAVENGLSDQDFGDLVSGNTIRYQQRVIAAKAVPQADASNLRLLMQQREALRAYEGTALRNLDGVVALAGQVDTTGSPVVERWIRAGRRAITGDNLVTAFDFQVNSLIPEIARIQTQPRLVGQLTDTARNEARSFVNGDMTAANTKTIRAMLRWDAQNRRYENDQAVNRVLERLGQPPLADAASEPPPFSTVLNEVSNIEAGKDMTSTRPTPGAPYRVRQNGHTYERQPDGTMKAID